MTIPIQPRSLDDEPVLGDGSSSGAGPQSANNADPLRGRAADRAPQRPPELGHTEHLVAPPSTGWLVLLVLLAALVVDVVAFHNVIMLVLNTEREYFTWAVVVGFALLALWLAHEMGERARLQVERHKPALTSVTGWIICVVWLSLGLFAFFVRVEMSGGPTLNVGGVQIGGGTGSPALQGLLFLSLYLATGAVAGFTGFKRRNPAIKAFRKSERVRRKAAEKLHDLDAMLARLRKLEEQATELGDRRDHERESELARADTEVTRLVQHAKAYVAQVEQRRQEKAARSGGFWPTVTPRRRP